MKPYQVRLYCLDEQGKRCIKIAYKGKNKHAWRRKYFSFVDFYEQFASVSLPFHYQHRDGSPMLTIMGIEQRCFPFIVRSVGEIWPEVQP